MLEKIKKILLDYVEVDPATLTGETEFLKDLHMNSFDIMTMIGQLEDEFGITIDDEDLTNIVTLQNLADYLVAKL